MSSVEISEWRAKQRRLRKAERQRNNRLRKKELLKSMKEELPELKSKVEEIKKDAQILCEIKGVIAESKNDATSTPVKQPQDSGSAATNKLDDHFIKTDAQVDTSEDTKITANANADHSIKTDADAHVDTTEDTKVAANANADHSIMTDLHTEKMSQDSKQHFKDDDLLGISQDLKLAVDTKGEDCNKIKGSKLSTPIPLPDDDFSIADDLDLGIDEDLFQDGSNGITIPNPNLEPYEMAIVEEFDVDRVFD